MKSALRNRFWAAFVFISLVILFVKFDTIINGIKQVLSIP